MTRRQQIIEAAYKEAEIERQLKMHPQVFEQGFVAGAEWADAHPDIDARTQHPRWISVADELPPCQEDVLLWSSVFDDVFKGFRFKDNLYYIYDDDDYWHSATHWMPLPEMPKKGGEQ